MTALIVVLVVNFTFGSICAIHFARYERRLRKLERVQNLHGDRLCELDSLPRLINCRLKRIESKVGRVR
jgi:hypothetical protein